MSEQQQFEFQASAEYLARQNRIDEAVKLRTPVAPIPDIDFLGPQKCVVPQFVVAKTDF